MGPLTGMADGTFGSVSCPPSSMTTEMTAAEKDAATVNTVSIATAFVLGVRVARSRSVLKIDARCVARRELLRSLSGRRRGAGVGALVFVVCAADSSATLRAQPGHNASRRVTRAAPEATAVNGISCPQQSQ